MNSSESLYLQFSRIQKRSWIIGGVALVSLALGAIRAPEQFYRSYLFAYLFWVGIAIGCTEVVMLQHLVGGRWGLAIRRLLESGMRNLWVMGLLFLPILSGLRDLYLWAQPQVVAKDAVLQHKAVYLNVPFFTVRVVVYFTVWLVFAFLLYRGSKEEDETGNPAIAARLRALSGPGLVLFGLTVTFSAVDWVMSIEPHWASTIYGLIFIVGQVLSTLSFIILVTMVLSEREPLKKLLPAKVKIDLGNLLLTFVILWAYMAVSQLIIVWSANLQDEIPWYLRRTAGGWANVAIALAVFHFVIPFLLLLSRDVKRRGWLLKMVALLVLVIHLLDTFWLVEPGIRGARLQIHWMDFAAAIGLGGLWIGFYFRHLKAWPLVPRHDPRLAQALEHAEEA